MTLAVRAARTEDAEAIWCMLEPVFRSGRTYAIDTDIGRDDALSYWLGGAGAYVAEDEDGEALGTYYIRRNQAGGGSHVCNAGFVTNAQAQGRGIARAMLEHALIEAKALGYSSMQFNFVLANNARAVALWQTAGFETIGRIPRAFDHPDDGLIDALIMHRFL